MSAIGPSAGRVPIDQTNEVDQTGATDAATRATVDPLAMPQDIVDYVKKQNWGQMHLEWHAERRWDAFTSDPKNAAYAKKMHWKPAARQEGDIGNGMDFLAMHRAMLRILTKKFPQDASYFAGWKTPPTDPRDPQNPVPSGARMDPKALKAIDTLNHIEQHMADFPDDDALGRFIETSLGPSMDPKLGMKGLHNYLHNRFSNPQSKIDVGDPTVNLQNQLFWRLHGWIDGIWTRYRAAKGESETDPAYAKALKDATKNMSGPMHMGSSGTPKGAAETPEPPPASATKFFETHPG
jgi:hypothetical protein